MSRAVPLILKLAWLPEVGLVLFSGMMQPDTVTAKHLMMFSLCADALNVKEAVLNGDLMVLTEAGLWFSNLLNPMAPFLLTTVPAVTSIQTCFCLQCSQLVKSCLSAVLLFTEEMLK